MRIEHILEQGSGARNEDYLISDGDIHGVFDGATSLDGAVFEHGRTGGLLAASIAGEAFRGNHEPLVRLGARANAGIRSGMEERQVDVSRRCSLWSASAAVVRLRDGAVEWFQTGDAQVVFVDKSGGFKVAARRPDHDYATLQMIKERGRFHPDVRARIETVRQGMNRDYGVLNGEDAAEGFFRTGLEPLDNIRTVLLFTDGLDVPGAAPAPFKDFSAVVRMAQASGLDGLRAHVRAIEAADPDIERYPRFKRHDDIAAIAIHP
jgi:hypothetical protein